MYEITGLNPTKLKSKKQRALYKALLQRKREQDVAQIEWIAANKKKTKVGYFRTYSGASLIPIPQQKVTHLSGNSVIRTVSLGTEVSG